MFHIYLDSTICTSLRHLKLIAIKSLSYACKGYAEIQRKLEDIINRKVVIVLRGRADAFAQYIILHASWWPRQRGREAGGKEEERKKVQRPPLQKEIDTQTLLYKQSSNAY